MSAIISLDDYFNHGYPKPPNDQPLVESAIELLRRVNILLENAAHDGVHTMPHPRYKGAVADGWRPPGMGSESSKHRIARACDVSDHADRRVAVWICRNMDLSEELGLYYEDFRWTKGRWTNWVHAQMVAPGSGRRVYVPYSDTVKNPATDPDFYARNGLKAP